MTHEFLQSLLSWPVSFPRKSSERISCPWTAIKQHFMGQQFIFYSILLLFNSSSILVSSKAPAQYRCLSCTAIVHIASTRNVEQNNEKSITFSPQFGTLNSVQMWPEKNAIFTSFIESPVNRVRPSSQSGWNVTFMYSLTSPSTTSLLISWSLSQESLSMSALTFLDSDVLSIATCFEFQTPNSFLCCFISLRSHFATSNTITCEVTMWPLTHDGCDDLRSPRESTRKYEEVAVFFVPRG